MDRRPTPSRSACAIVALGIVTQACTFAPALMPSEDVEQFAERYAAAFAAGDAEAVTELLTDDFVAMAPEAPPLIGKQAVAEQIRQDFARFRVRDLAFVPVESHVGDGWAWVRGRSEGSMVAAGVRHLLPLDGKFLWILQLSEDGQWRLARDASSASRPHTHAK